MKNTKNVPYYSFGFGAVDELDEILSSSRREGSVAFFVDYYFQSGPNQINLPVQDQDRVIYVDTTNEPKTSDVDFFLEKIRSDGDMEPKCVVGLGGGATLDVAKAVSNLLTNEGKAEDYQGWDLVQHPGVYKIGIPTLSGTGAEASRTCVMTNPKNGLKLGMNSDFTIYDQLILDPNLSKSVPRDQYFYSGMDSYIHCIESLNGSYRHPVGDAFSDQSLKLVQEVFHSSDMMSDENRAKLMIASYLGGCAIANSFVGVVHPFSAGLSVVLGAHHCIANCITMLAMEEFYPREYEEFQDMVKAQDIQLQKGICSDCTDDQFQALYDSTVIHEKPLKNALGDHFLDVLTKRKVREIFERM